jgi:predicted pyridoxine 5'-phosphate oxidase superfamily flavin-nucleotide-binding protein
MAQIPNFDRIVATVTAADIEKFLNSAAPEDDKQRVRNAPTTEIRMRLVGGYLIRTNQVTAARLNPASVKTKVVKAAKAAKATKTPKATKAAKAPDAEEPVVQAAASADVPW